MYAGHFLALVSKIKKIKVLNISFKLKLLNISFDLVKFEGWWVIYKSLLSIIPFSNNNKIAVILLL